MKPVNTPSRKINPEELSEVHTFGLHRSLLAFSFVIPSLIGSAIFSWFLIQVLRERYEGNPLLILIVLLVFVFVFFLTLPSLKTFLAFRKITLDQDVHRLQGEVDIRKHRRTIYMIANQWFEFTPVLKKEIQKLSIGDVVELEYIKCGTGFFLAIQLLNIEKKNTGIYKTSLETAENPMES